MSFFKRLKDIIFFEEDKEFFDKEATIKEYMKICPPSQRKSVSSYDELYQEALKHVDKQNFKENTKHLENYFYELTNMDNMVAILTGIAAFQVARFVDDNGKKIEKSIDNVLPKGYDQYNPFDVKVGKSHRDFGHDIFTMGLKNIPNDFPVLSAKMGRENVFQPIGEVVGKSGDISMFDLIWTYYGKSSSNPLKGVFNCLGHTVVHFSKDLLTSEGLPLPFSSLLNDYINNMDGNYGYEITPNDYVVVNKFNRFIDKNKANLKASDFGSLAFIEGMCAMYAKSKKLDNRREKSFKRDMKIISMGTCTVLQMSCLVLAQGQGKKQAVPGAKTNLVMLGSLFKNMITEMNVVIDARREVNAVYRQQC